MLDFRLARWTVGLLSSVGLVGSEAHSWGLDIRQDFAEQSQPNPDTTSPERASLPRSAPQRTVDGKKVRHESSSSTERSQQGVSSNTASASSQSSPASAAEPSSVDEEEIVVDGQRPRGSVVGKIPAEQTYTALEIRAYGSDNIDSLLRDIGPQVTSNRGTGESRPLVLLNGKRVSSFSEIAKIPTEAIERMEVFPEEQALAYGFQPNQKVVNIVTFETFASKVAQTNYAVTTDRGYDKIGTAGTLLIIKKGLRFNLNAELQKTGNLLERERGIRQPLEAVDQGGFRTLLPANRNLSLSSVLSSPVLNDISGSISGRFESDKSRSFLGAGPSGQLTRDVSTRTIRLGTTFNGLVGKWLWSATGNYDRDDINLSTTNRASLRLLDGAVSSNEYALVDVSANGPVLNLPAGAAALSLRGGFGTRNFSSRSQGDFANTPNRLSRGTSAIQASLDLPLSRSRKGSSGLGRLTANINVRVEKLSDFGTQKTFGYGFYWTPVKALNVYLSVKDEERAPTIEQLGTVRIETPNARIFDFAQGRSAVITQISGGNRALVADSANTLSLGIYTKPFGTTDLTLSANYVRTRVRDPIVTFPIATAGIEAGFPERFLRGADGQLLQIDSRPLNFKRSDQSRLRSGVNFSKPLGKGPPPPAGTTVLGTQFYPNEAAMRAATPPGVTIIEVADGSDEAKRIDASASRLTFALYYTLNLEDRIRVQTGGPTLDLLNGSATGFLGGTPRHEIELQAGIFKKGLGARVTASWRSETTIRGLTADPVNNIGMLRFLNYSTTNLSLFLLPAQRFEGADRLEWLAGTRVTIDISNVFNNRPRVVDQAGFTPLNYQSAYLDPAGRIISLSFRKTF